MELGALSEGCISNFGKPKFFVCTKCVMNHLEKYCRPTDMGTANTGLNAKKIRFYSNSLNAKKTQSQKTKTKNIYLRLPTSGGRKKAKRLVFKLDFKFLKWNQLISSPSEPFHQIEKFVIFPKNSSPMPRNVLQSIGTRFFIRFESSETKATYRDIKAYCAH